MITIKSNLLMKIISYLNFVFAWITTFGKEKNPDNYSYVGFAAWPFVVIAPDYAGEHTLNHEMIHNRQQRELWLIGFYVLYAYYYLRNRKTMKPSMAYRMIPFEREAYRNQANRIYLMQRKPMAWKEFVNVPVRVQRSKTSP